MSLSPTNPVPPIHRWYVWTVLFLALLSTATAIGLRLAPYIADKLGNRPVAMIVHPTPEAKIPDAWKSLIAGARKDIFLAAGQLSSEVLAIELDAAARRGVSVLLILPKDANPDSMSGIRLWLSQNDSPIEVALDPVPFAGTLCVIDGRIAITTSQPLASTDTLARLGGYFASYTDPSVIQEIRKMLVNQASRSLYSPKNK